MQKHLEWKLYKDFRGHFKEDFNSKYHGGKKFVFGCISKSKKNIIRGLHIQTKNSQGKHVSVLKGSILDVAVDLRKGSKTFGKHFKIMLSDSNGKSIYIPEGFAHGFLTLDKENIVYYFNTNFRAKKYETGIMWNDNDLKINWGIKKPVLSNKDKINLTLKEFTKLYRKK